MGSIVAQALPLLGSGLVAALPAMIMAAPALMAGKTKEEIDANPNDPKFDGIPYAEKVRENLKNDVDVSEGGLGGQQGLKQRAKTARGTDQYSPEIQQELEAAKQQILDDTELRGGIPAEKLPKRKNTKLKAGEFKDESDHDHSDELEPENQFGKDIPVTMAKPEKPTATPVSKVEEEYKSPLNAAEENAYNLYNEERDKSGKDPILMRDLKDPTYKKMWTDTVKNKGFLKEDSPKVMDSDTTKTPSATVSEPETSDTAVPVSETPDGTRLQKSSAEYDDSQPKTRGATTVLINSPSTNVINGGGGDVLIEKLTGVRTDDSTIKKVQLQNYRWV